MLKRKQLNKNFRIISNHPSSKRILSSLQNTFPNESITEKLTRLHCNERKNLTEIGRIFHIPSVTIKRYMLRLDIPLKLLTNEERSKRSREKAFLMWRDPEIRKKMINGRSKKDIYRVIKKQIIASLWSQQTTDKKMIKVLIKLKLSLGENPKIKLEKMYYDDKLTPKEIAKQVKLRPESIRELLKMFEIKKTI